MKNTIERIKAATGIRQSFHGSNGDEHLFGFNFTMPSRTFEDGVAHVHTPEERHGAQIRTAIVGTALGAVAAMSYAEVTSITQLISTIS